MKKHRATRILAALIAVAAVLSLSGCAAGNPTPDPVEPPSVTKPPPAVSSTPARTPEPAPEPEPQRAPIEAWPVRMRIPALSVDAEIQDTDPCPQYTFDIVPSAHIISWMRTSAIPGNDGNSLMGGHNRWGGQRGQLIDLDTLNVGDIMEIEYADGTVLTFMLESVFVYALATAPADLILDTEGEARVTVITCKEPYNPSTGTSDNRIVAVFKEKSVFVTPEPPVTPFPLREA